jgi:metallophosphoesterase (TIGR00282 family)
MQLKLLCIGDVVGRPGRYIVAKMLPHLIRRYEVDCVIANVENAAGGSGLTPQLYKKFLHYGVDLMTLGDHAFRRMEIAPVLDSSDRIVRPANFPSQAPGKEFIVFQTDRGPRVALIAVLGRMFMKPTLGCPYATVDRLLAQIDKDADVVVVEMHAETTSEKIAMGWHLDGRVSLVFGTHTHVQTADECVLPQGTGYITDLGMTGPHDSVLGRSKERVLRSLITAVPTPFTVADGDPRLSGILAVVDAANGRAVSVERVMIQDEELSPSPAQEMDEPPLAADLEV